ncbi:MAG: OB-fold domain-containing protein [Hyphomonadaceae bacterium]|nr:OB-fold domain-containing protein [Hyphomonadaceae bacterium]
MEGLRCDACGEIIVGEPRRACPKCFTVGALKPCRLCNRGSLYTYTIVHRSFPGIKTPFVSAIVDLDGGGVIKGNLIGVDDKDIEFGMPVRVVFEEVEGSDGKRCVRHVVEPRRARP